MTTCFLDLEVEESVSARYTSEAHTQVTPRKIGVYNLVDGRGRFFYRSCLQHGDGSSLLIWGPVNTQNAVKHRPTTLVYSKDYAYIALVNLIGGLICSPFNIFYQEAC